MAKRAASVLPRNNPDKTPLCGHVKVTPEDWLNVARGLLVSEGAAPRAPRSISGKMKPRRRGPKNWHAHMCGRARVPLRRGAKAQREEAVMPCCGR